MTIQEVDSKTFYAVGKGLFEKAGKLYDAFNVNVNILGGTGSMAGTDDAGKAWATSYDERVKEVLGAVNDLTKALENYGGVVTQAGYNHAVAEHNATPGNQGPAPARHEPTLAAELRAELASADHVDLLCAFVKWQGLRLLEDQLNELRRRGVPLRVITTTYLGATDARALDALVNEFGAEVRVNYETDRTRLHAKAWLLRRNTGFHTAYVGSSNLSHAALVDGLEWNVRLSAMSTPHLLEKFRATFDSYWENREFELYRPGEDGDRLRAALETASGTRPRDRLTVTLSGLEVHPKPYQAEMLEELDAERTIHDRHRNLIVAATGTGKTVIAALDYRRLARDIHGRDLTLLFVAHRKEILQQSRRMYRRFSPMRPSVSCWWMDKNPPSGATCSPASNPFRRQAFRHRTRSLRRRGDRRVPPRRSGVVPTAA